MTSMLPRPLWHGRILALFGIIFVAANLRTAVGIFSPLVNDINVDIPLNVISIGVVGMLPPVCFAIFGIATPSLTRRFALETVLLVSLVAITTGHFVRGISNSYTVLLWGSIIIFAGLGAANVLLPPLVKKYFPDRVGAVTSLYATVISFCALVPPLVAVPVAEGTSWRVSLSMWAVLGVFAIVPWVAVAFLNRITPEPGLVPGTEHIPLAQKVWHSSIAWAMAIIFGISGLNAYAMFGWLPQILIYKTHISETEAGTLLAWYAAIGIPAALFVPTLAVRLKNINFIIIAGVMGYVAGYLGLLLLPETGTWLWVALAGAGSLIFPLVLVLINLRTRTHPGSIALSGFVQSVGYVIAATGPFIVGLLNNISDSWDWPLIFLIATAFVALPAGFVIARPLLLEDELERHTSQRVFRK